MDTTSEDFLNGLERVEEEYNKEYLTPELNLMTTMKDKVTVMKNYSVRPKEYYNDRYERHNGETYQMTTIKIRPRKFYRESELKAYMRYLERLAGRTIEEAEMMLLLRHITNGRQYELTCLIDRTKELDKVTMWRDNK